MSHRTPWEQRESYCLNTLRPQLIQLDKYMNGHKFVAGNKLSYVDFYFWEILDHIVRFDDSFLFDSCSNLKRFQSDFAALPKIAAYISSPRFMIAPCNNPMAKWGADLELKKTW